MRISALAGLFAFATIVATVSLSASVKALDLGKTNMAEQKILTVNVLEPMGWQVNGNVEKPVASASTPKPELQAHIVGVNETLSSIAEQYHTSWTRLFNKNEQIVSPDMIKAGDIVTIPLADEELKERPLPEPVVQLPVVKGSVKSAQPPATSRNVSVAASRGVSTGNTYSPGYCTWYAKNMRPDLPNNLGNANTWVTRAAAQGFATGTVPRVGAIGQQGMHVVYVQQVNSDGTVTISEMNYNGLYVISNRTVPASSFRYIY